MERKRKKAVLRKSGCALLTAVFICCAILSENYISYADETSSQNRFNIEIVLDASNSMNYTDPDGLRYEAISQFVNLLANEGNYLGGAVFSNKVEAQQPLSKIKDEKGKKAVVEKLKSVMSTEVTDKMGYTNIGDGIDKAVADLEENGSSDLPSVIVFLSDGNTEMPSDEEQVESLDQKADAIERARDKGIRVYSICLNANGKADMSEMAQISKATSGESKEVKNAEDLTDVFNTFYALIYGSSSIALEEGEFPENGELNTEFDVPGVGVEEVNIIANGQVDELHVFDPKGDEVKAKSIKSQTYTMVKLVDLSPGKWSMITKGSPGTKIKINMVYNTDLGVNVKLDPGNSINAGDTMGIVAVLTSGDKEVTDTEMYGGYQAEAIIKDAYGKELESVPMSLKEGGFYCDFLPEEGVYYAQVTIKGNYLERISDDIGPITVAKEEPPVNTPPEPVEDTIKKTVRIWPFKGGSLDVDLSTLAKDKQDKKLRYTIESSSYIEGEDYKLDGDNLKMTHFSLSKGTFDIKATDTGGLSCNINLKVQTINVGLLALIGMGVIAFVVLMVFLIMLRIALTKPFRGKLTIQSNVGGQIKGKSVQPRRGRCKLSLFQLDPTGLDYSKSYIQASGSNYVTLVADKPVIVDGRTSNTVKIQSGVQTTVKVKQETTDIIQIRFESRMRDGGRSTSRRGGTGTHSRPSSGDRRGRTGRTGTPRRPSGGSRGRR